MDAYGIETALDVSKVVPSTYTTSIFGINGNVNIRGVPSDTYFRGVKRLENTQLFPSPITAMSRLDVVRGPPSPIYGPGKMGGYTNFIPKSARASTGKYLERPSGEISLTYGSYNKKAISAEVGGPMAPFEKHGGYYVYLNAENSDTYWDNVYFDQYIVQSSFDIELSPVLRMEFGQMYQYWGGTELAGWNRLTQELVDTGMYNSGLPLLNMDTDGDGLISTAEVDAIGPLVITLPLDTTTEEAANALPDNWLVDPSTTGLVEISRRANSQSSEDGGEANIFLAYLDFVYEPSPDTTFTSKTYTEWMDRYKWTRASGFGQDTRSKMAEQKFIYDKNFGNVSEWLTASVSASALIRFYNTENYSGTKYNDLVNRADLSRPFDQVNRFAVPNLEPELAPWGNALHSEYITGGFGLLTDLTIGERTNIVIGARWDAIDAYSFVPDDVLHPSAGTSATGSDDGFSYTVSLSHEIVDGVRPYITYAEQETLIYGTDGGISTTIVADGPYNPVELQEIGIKASLFENKLFGAVSAYHQTRNSFTFETGQVLSTTAEGLEVEVRWVPIDTLILTAGGTWQKTEYTPVRPAITTVNGAVFGLPADDYIGGRLRTTVEGEEQYAERSGYPGQVINLNGTYLFPQGFSANLSVSYQDEMYSGRSKSVLLPEALIVGGAISYDRESWGIRVQVNNITDELYFTPNAPDGIGDVIVIPAPERNYQVRFTYRF